MKYFPTFSKVWNAIKGAVLNRFEAATQLWNGTRRWIWPSYQDARFDVTRADAIEICRKHLDLVANTPILQQIRNRFIQYSPGVDGLCPIPNAQDSVMSKDAIHELNAALACSFNRFWKSPELGSNKTGNELTIQWEGMLFDLGNPLIHLTHDEHGRPKIQTIDFLRLQTPPEMGSEEGKTIFGGIQLKKISVPCRDKSGKVFTKEVVTGKPEFYYIRNEFDSEIFAKIPASEMIHEFRAFRPGVLIGVPAGVSGINTVIDATDLQILQMTASKIGAEIAVVESNASGELDAMAARRTRLNIQSQNSSGALVTKRDDQFYDVSFGGKKLAIHHGDSLKDFVVETPSVAQTGQMVVLKSAICMAYNVPLALIESCQLPIAQGTLLRSDLEMASGAFRGDFEIIAKIVRKIYEWYIKWAIDYDPSLKGINARKVENCFACFIRPPRSISVDAGYSADTLAKELEMGTTTFQDVCAGRNLDWRDQIRQGFEVESFKQKCAIEFPDVDPSKIANWNFVTGKIQVKEEEKPSQKKEEPVEA